MKAWIMDNLNFKYTQNVYTWVTVSLSLTLAPLRSVVALLT